MSRVVIRITMDIESNFKAEVHKAQTIPNSSKKLITSLITQSGPGVFTLPMTCFRIQAFNQDP
jgi:hypothetical protein